MCFCAGRLFAGKQIILAVWNVAKQHARKKTQASFNNQGHSSIRAPEETTNQKL
jgi:hypothetical protein